MCLRPTAATTVCPAWRYASTPPPPATLSGLTVVAGGTTFALDPVFASATTAYAAVVPSGTATVTVAATAADTGATVTITPTDAASGTNGHQVALAPGANTVMVQVTVDGKPAGAYTVTVNRNRAPPVLSTAVVDGVELVLTYDKTLDGTSVPATGAFTVTANGTAVSVSTVSVSGMAVTLDLATAVLAGQTVEVDYAVPSSNPLQDTAGTDAGALVDQAVENQTLAAEPVWTALLQIGSSSEQSGYIESDLGGLEPGDFEFGGVRYTVRELLATTNGLDFEVDRDGLPTGGRLTLEVANSAGNQVLVLSGAGPKSWSFGSDSTHLGRWSSGYFTTVCLRPTAATTVCPAWRYASTRSVAATLSGLTVAAGGTTFTLAPVFASATTAYAAGVPAGTATVTVAATATDTGATVTITPTDAASGTSGHQVALAPGANTVVVQVTVDGKTAGAYTVTVTAAAPLSEPEAPSAPSVSAVSGQIDQLSVSWTAPSDGNSAITDYDVRYCGGAAADCTADADFTEHAFTGTSTSTTIAMLMAATEHQVQVRAINGEGAGLWSASGSGTTAAPMLTAQIDGGTPRRVVEGDTLEMTVSLSGAPGRQVELPLIVREGGGLTSSEYSVAPSSLTFGATETQRTFTVTAVDDSIAEATGTLAILLNNSQFPLGITGPARGVTVRVVDDDFSYEAIHAGGVALSVAEGAGALTVTVRVSSPANIGVKAPELAALGETVEVSVSSADGTATAGSDYTALSGLVLSFAASDFDDRDEHSCDCARARKTVVVPITDDTSNETAETFTLTLSHESPQRVTYPSGGATATVTIADDDMPATSATLSGLTVAAGGTTFTLAPAFASVTTAYAATVPAAAATVTVAATATDTGATVTVTPTDAASGTVGHQVALAPGSNTVVAQVTVDGKSAGAYTVTVTRRNAPVFTVAAGSLTVAENAATNTDIPGGTYTATDADGDSVAYALTGTDAAAFTLRTASGSAHLRPLALDFETASSHALTVTASDGRGESTATAVTVTVTDVDEPPGAPAAPAVSAVSGQNDRLAVSWAVPENTGPPITDNDVRVCPGAAADCTADNDFSAHDFTGTATATTIAMLMAATEHQVQVRAINAEGTGAWSGSGSGTTGTPMLTAEFVGAQFVDLVEGGTLEMTVRLSGAPGRQVVIPLDTRNRFGASSSDYTGVPPSLTFEATETERSFTVAAVDDPQVDLGEVLVISFGAPAPSGITLPESDATNPKSRRNLSLVDNDFLYEASYQPSGSYEAAEAAGALTVTVRLQTPGNGSLQRPALNLLNETVEVSVSSADGTATAGSDYTALSGLVLSFAAADFADQPSGCSTGIDCARAEKTVVVPIADDTVDDEAETFTLTLSHVTGQRVEYPASSGGATATVTIADDDAPPMPRLVADASAVSEGDADLAVALSVDLSASSGYAAQTVLTLDFSTGTAVENTDFSAPAKSVTIEAASMAVVAAGTVTITNDAEDEDPEEETVVVQLKDGATVLSSATITVTDDDDPAVTVRFGADAYTASEGGAGAVVSVSVSEDPERELVIELEGSDDDVDGDGLPDWSGIPGSVTFTATTVPAQWERTFTVTALDDAIDDDDESVKLSFGSLPTGVTEGDPDGTEVELVDNDMRGVTLSRTRLEITETDTDAAETYTMVLTSQPTAAVTVALLVSSGEVLPTLPTTSPASLTFMPSEWAAAQTVTVTAPADNDSVDETARVSHSVSGGDYGLNGVSARLVTVVVDDDETASTGVGLSVSPVTVSEGAGATAVVVTGRLDNAALKGDLGVALSGAAGLATEASDYTASGLSGLTLTIAAQATSGTATFMLTAQDDLLYEAEMETFEVGGVVQSGPPVLGRPGAVNLVGATATAASVTLASDDAAPALAFTAAREELSEQDDTQTPGLDERVAQLVLSITNGVGFEQEQTVELEFGAPAGARSATRGADYTDDATGNALTLAAGVAGASATVTVTAQDDTLDEDDGTAGLDDEDERLAVTARHGGVVVETLALAILDDDHPVVQVSYSAASYTAEEDGSSDAEVAVVLSVPSGNAGPERELEIVLTQAIADGEVPGNASASDYSGVPGTVTFAATGLLAQRFTVTATDDAVDDDGETVRLGFGMLPAGVSAGAPGSSSVMLEDDDERGLVFAPESLTVTDQGLGGGSGNGAYGLSLMSEPTAAVTVSWSSDVRIQQVRQGGSAVTSLTFTTSDWDTQKTLQLILVPDTDAANNEIPWGQQASGGDYAGWSQSYTVTEIDSDRVAEGVRLLLRPSQLPEGSGLSGLTVTALLDGATLAAATTVRVSLSGGTAVSGTDYTATPAALTIEIPSQTQSGQGSFQLTPTDDSVVEEDETIVVSGTAASGSTTLAVEAAEFVLRDNDSPGVTVSEGLLQIAEGDEGDAARTASYTVVLDSAPTGAVTVSVSSGDTGAVTVSPGSLPFDGTNWAVEQTVTATAVPDEDGFDEEVRLSHAVTGADYAGVPAADVSVTVFDDEVGASGVVLSLSPPTLAEGAGATAVSVTARLDGGALGTATAVSVAFEGVTAGSADYRAQPARFTLTIPAESLSATATVTVTPAADREDEFDETVRVSGTAAGGLLPVSSVLLTITDDDTRGVTVSPTDLAVDERGRERYTVVLDSAPTGAVTVRASVAGDASVRVSPGALVFTAQDSAAKTVVVSARGDADEADGQAVVSHAVSGADYGANGVAAAAVTVTVTDTGTITADLVLSLDDESTLEEGGGARRLVATVALLSGGRASALSVPVTVEGVTAEASDFRASPSRFTVRILAMATSGTATFTLEPVDDGLDEEDETLVVRAEAPAGLEADEGVTLTIVDDDMRGVTVEPTSLMLAEGARGSYTVSLGSQPSASVTVRVELSGSDSVTASASRLVFTGSNWRRAQAVTVRSAQDLDTDDESVMITHAVSGGDYGSETAEGVSVTVTDDDQPSTKVVLSLSGASSLAEGGGARAVTVVGRLDGVAEAQAVTVTLSAGGGTASAADYTAPGAVLTIAAGQVEARTAFTVEPVDDRVDEADETLVVSGSLSSAQVLAVEPAAGLTVTIVDDDERGVTVTPTALTVAEGGSVTYTVALGSQPDGGAVAVTLSLSDDDANAATDASVMPRSLTFQPSDWRTAQTVTVTVAEDLGEVEADATATIAHAVLGADYGAELAASVSVSVPGHELTADGQGVRLLVAPSGEVTVPTGTPAPAGLNLSLLAHAGATVEVRAAAAPGAAPRGFRLGDTVVDLAGVELGSGETATLCLPSAEAGERSVQRWDGDTMAWIALAAPVGGSRAGAACGVTDHLSVFAVMVRLEEPELVFTPPALRVEIGAEEGAAYTVALGASPAGSVTVTVASDHAGLSVSPGLLVFTEADWSQPRTVTATVVEDAEPSAATLRHVAAGGRYLAEWTAALAVELAVETGLLSRARKAWLARFGRTVAGQVAEAVAERLSAPAGQAAALQLGGSAAESALLSGALQALGGEARPEPRRVLGDSLFVLPLSVGGAQGGWTAWGRGAYTEFDGADGGLQIDGEVAGATVGLDREEGRWRLGLALSHSEGDGEVREAEGDRIDYESSLSGVHPYARWRGDDGRSAWGVLGWGEGELKETRDGERTETDLEMRMAAFGARGALGEIESGWGRVEVSLKSEVLAVRLEAEADADLPEVEADAQRVRLLLEGAGQCPLEWGGLLAPTLEAGLRWDGGDAETGLGAEIGAGLRYADESGRLSAVFTARGLLAHEESDYDEWGVGGSLHLKPDRAGRGLSLRLESGYGSTGSGTQELWTRRDLSGLAAQDDVAPAGRLQAELGYGLNGPGGRGAWTPYAAYHGGENSEVRLGARLDFGEAMRLDFSVVRRGGGEQRNGIELQIEGRW